MWRGGLRCSLSVAASFVWRCLNSETITPFHILLIEPDMQISRIRLSDKTHTFAHERSYAVHPTLTQDRVIPVHINRALCI